MLQRYEVMAFLPHPPDSSERQTLHVQPIILCQFRKRRTVNLFQKTTILLYKSIIDINNSHISYFSQIFVFLHETMISLTTISKCKQIKSDPKIESLHTFYFRHVNNESYLCRHRWWTIKFQTSSKRRNRM